MRHLRGVVCPSSPTDATQESCTQDGSRLQDWSVGQVRGIKENRKRDFTLMLDSRVFCWVCPASQELHIKRMLFLDLIALIMIK